MAANRGPARMSLAIYCYGLNTKYRFFFCITEIVLIWYVFVWCGVLPNNIKYDFVENMHS